MIKYCALGILIITPLYIICGKRSLEVTETNGSVAVIQLATNRYKSNLQEALVECQSTCEIMPDKYINKYGATLMNYILKNVSRSNYRWDRLLKDYDKFTEFFSVLTLKISPQVYQNTTLVHELDEVNAAFNSIIQSKKKNRKTQS